MTLLIAVVDAARKAAQERHPARGILELLCARCVLRGRSLARDPLHCAAMAKVCHSCGKGPAFGNSRSHSMVATRRRFDPNLQKVRIVQDGTARRVYVCTRCLKAGKVSKAL